MTTNEINFNYLKEHIDSLIGKNREDVSSALSEMEKFNISEEDFMLESFNLNVAALTLGYLNKIKEVVETSDYKTNENYIRFHKHQIETKTDILGNPDKTPLHFVHLTLSNIIDLYLDN